MSSQHAPNGAGKLTEPTELKRHIAYRTCVVTRSVKPTFELLRCVAQPGDTGTMKIVPDPRRRLSGRGAWISPDAATVEKAIARRTFIRALRLRTNTVDYSELMEHVAQNGDNR